MLDMWIRACNNYDYNEKYMFEHFIYGYRSNMLQSLCNVISMETHILSSCSYLNSKIEVLFY